ncbi:hypothetical protein G7L40_26935 (plasmid) [Paenibacillus polymyxa]|uniref:hypothetical protein n=1 Tax=Paenibacillus polymyxa TaxID=1406 RepID=UPI000E1C13E1|nr:hypothetical protein [Paenibacillus polymyxa]MBE7901092.1 hypothetical protein [Paenibacillus polymyxa]MCC3261676.1 hypothetical protein [Paenibacillus polymyxa]QPK56315.1 hypothetical protein G7035_27015 [Paenibacillus polymyxa]QPK61332.1 hypothetical protein G7L40_26935 [Paenibacillus polymyxa]UOD88794.1 hypothetical protein CUU60_26965 [Paenibacillus polymyxa ATCC 842]
MNKRLRTGVVVLGLTVLIGGVVTVIQSQTFANEIKNEVKVTGDSKTSTTKTEIKAIDDSNWL